MSEYLTQQLAGARVTRLNIPAPDSARVASISSRQGKRALLIAGLYYSALEAINALPEPQRTAALIDWDAPTWLRSDPTLAQMAIVLGLSGQQLDELFSQAAGL